MREPLCQSLDLGAEDRTRLSARIVFPDEIGPWLAAVRFLEYRGMYVADIPC